MLLDRKIYTNIETSNPTYIEAVVEPCKVKLYEADEIEAANPKV